MRKDTRWVGLERRRIEARHRILGIARSPDEPTWGLALSGGGIRSATFSLGILQALARARSPARSRPWLAEFDYLSTVSGGGYIGTFFVSLFLPKRLEPAKERAPRQGFVARALNATRRAYQSGRQALGLAPAQPPSPEAPADEQASREAARLAYEVLAQDPPGRIRSSGPYDPRRTPLAWLRENGRYLTPTGAGDFLYAAALGLRNWASLHYVIGTALFTLFAAVFALEGMAMNGLACGRSVGPPWCLSLADWNVPPAAEAWPVWWSPLWLLPALVLAAWIAPSGLAYWLSSGEKRLAGRASALERFFGSVAMWFALLISGVLAMLFARAAGQAPGPLRPVVGALAAIGFIAVALYGLSALRTDNVPKQRVALTRWLASGLVAALALAAIALLDTASQSVYHWLSQPTSLWQKVSVPGVFAALIWLVRKAAFAATEKKPPRWLAAVPVNLIAGVVAVVLFFVLATAWGVFFQWLLWRGAAPSALTTALLSEQITLAGRLAGFGFALSLVNGYFRQFVNMSTMHQFYSARLVRAYLGASNAKRFGESDGRKWASAAEPHPHDEIPRADYFAEGVASPVHLVNITLNQTVDPAEQLVQRDRKGKCLALGPAGVLLDGKYYGYDVCRADFPMGRWVGLSGAAFTTGLGRATRLGISLLLGLANVRLGTWWKSGIGEDRSGLLERVALSLFPTQTYLFYEFMARFHGNHRPWHYLSDGGHFENTGAYELLRPERKVDVVVLCDNGCDPDYEFADLANLLRLVRIDFGAQIEPVHGFASDPRLAELLGTERELRQAEPGVGGKCALLFRVTYPPRDGQPAAERSLLVLKPRLIEGASSDVKQYQRTHREFPQQSTTDQFFDEAQWESYRQLGLQIGQLVFQESGEALMRLLRGGASRAVVREAASGSEFRRSGEGV